MMNQMMKKMNSKKAKGLRKLAKQLVIDGKRPLTEIDMWYKKMKKAYKFEKGQK